MDLRHVRTFVTVAEQGTVSKAALHLHTAQPALSRQIGDLERELGLKLFDRIGRRLRLTNEGEQLLYDCRSLLDYTGALAEKAQKLRRGDTGVLKISASPQHIESILAQLLHPYARRYPNVQVKVTEGASHETMGMLERGEVHIGQVLLHAIRLDEQRFASRTLTSVELLIAYHPSLNLGRGPAIEIEHLASCPLLLLDGGFGFRRAFDAACRVAGLRPKIKFESRSPHTLLALAESGHGAAIIPSALRTDRYSLRIARLVYRKRPLREPLTLLWDRRRSLPPYALAFLQMWTEHVRKAFPISRPTRLNDFRKRNGG
jgi:LysR family nitrogen assimilation transcriptional regulator